MPPRDNWRGGPPPWWPQGTRWHGSGGPWHAARRRFLWRLGLALAGLLLLLVALSVVGWLIFGHTDGARGSDGWGGPPIFGFIFLVGGALFIVHLLRRTAAPVGDLMEATGRLADGDFSTRVRPHGSPDVRRLATAFNTLAERLERDETRRRSLVADVTHELRTPLSVIRGTAEGVSDGVYPGDHEHIAPILDSVDTIARLIDDLATLSSAEAGQLALHRETISAHDLVDGALMPLRTAFEAAGITLANTAAADLPSLEVDGVRMRQVFSNILGNALRHTPPGGSVTVSAALAGDTMEFRVTDTGGGIPPDQLPHVFERFSKGASSAGSGLGLAIARGIVEAHGGSIHAESYPVAGTTIVIRLPADARP